MAELFSQTKIHGPQLSVSVRCLTADELHAFFFYKDGSKKKIEMRSLKKARKPISTFDRSKDNSEATKTWPRESAKKLHAGWKYVTQLAVQIRRHSVRDQSCALFWWEKKKKKSQGYFCRWGRDHL